MRSRSPTPACPATPAPGGLARLDWSVPDGTDAVIVELGANDMLRGVDPKVTRQALSDIVQRLKARHIEVLLCGMLAAPNLGPDFGRAFNAIYPELAAANDVLLYPFFLDGIVSDPKLIWATACIRPARAWPRSSTASCRRSRPCGAGPAKTLVTGACAADMFVGGASTCGLRRRPIVIRFKTKSQENAATVHRFGNTESVGPIAVAAARRIAGRTLDRSGKLPSDVAVHRRCRRRHRPGNRLAARQGPAPRFRVAARWPAIVRRQAAARRGRTRRAVASR